MTGRALPHRRLRHGRRAPTSRASAASPRILFSALLLTVAVAATALPVPAVAADADVARATPTVRHLHPAPGAVVAAGPVVVAAEVLVPRGTPRPETSIHLDGRPAQGRPVDPDGALTRLAGLEVDLRPGRHRLAVVSGDGEELVELRAWEVVAVGMDVAVADQDAPALADRLAGSATTAGGQAGPAVLYDRDRPDLALSVPLLVTLTGGRAVEVDQDGLDARAWSAVASSDAPPILLGDTISEDVAAALADVGHQPVRLEGATAADVAAATTAHVGSRVRAVVVAPSRPFDDALAGAVAAAHLNAGLLLVDDDPTGSVTADLLAGAPALLLSDQLTATARQAVAGLMAPEAVASDHDLLPAPAREAVVVPLGTDRRRALVAAASTSPDRPVLVGTADATRWVAMARPDRVTVVGPARPPLPLAQLTEPALPSLATTPALDPTAAAVEPVTVGGPAPGVRPPGTTGSGPRPATAPDVVAADLRRAWADGPDAPRVEALVDATDGLSVTLTVDRPVDAAEVHVDVLGYEWPGTTVVQGSVVRWAGGGRPPLPLPLEPGGPDAPTAVSITTTVTAGGATRHQTAGTVVGVDAADSVSPEGWVVAGGIGERVGSGRPYTFSVEVDPATGLDVGAVADEVERILVDPRGWTADGRLSLQRVGTHNARLRVVVATPATVDAHCGAAGLRTGGRVSCWDGYRAMLNLDRWTTGVTPFHTDIEVYRQYLVNHEVGHGLGHRHEFCPGAGALAPVMQQQTGGLGACAANGWPFPDAG